MLKRIFNFIMKDLTTAIRENITVMMLVFPLLSAGVVMIVLPGFESGSATFIVNENTVDEAMIEKIDDFGTVEKYQSDEKVYERVENFDDVIGITMKDGKYTAILEGNETGEAEEITDIIMAYVTADEHIIEFEYENVGNTKSFIKEFILSIILLACIQMGALAVAFNIVDEKESKAINAIAVSPLSMFEYIASRWFVILIISILLAFADSLIVVGFNANYLYLLLSMIVSAFMGLLLAYGIGGFANNQITAIAIMKVMFIVYTGLPIGAFFTPEKFQFFFYPFPNYWMFNTFANMYIEPQSIGFWPSLGLTLGTSLLFLLVMMPILAKKLKLR